MDETRKNLVDDLGIKMICIGDYEISLKECISYGGRSLVYQGKCNERTVIVKELYPMLDSVDRVSDGEIIYKDEDIHRLLKKEFQDEYDKIRKNNAQSGSSVETMTPICYGECFGTSYIIMEYVKGCTLEQYNKNHIYSSMKEVLELIENIAKVIDEHIHKRGMVHLDIKPDNLWIIENQMGYPVIRMLDYGCMTEIGKVPTIPSRSKGYSPYDIYADNEKAELNYDTYSICAILFDIILGNEYDDNSSLNIQDIVAGSEFEQAEIFEGMSKSSIASIGNILIKGLYGLKEYRYANVDAFIADINKAKKYVDYKKIYIDHNISESYYMNIKARGVNKNPYFTGKRYVEEFVTNDYKYAVDAVLADVINIGNTKNISILKYDTSIENTLKNLCITSPVVYGSDNKPPYSFDDLKYISDEAYIIIWGGKSENVRNELYNKRIREVVGEKKYILIISDKNIGGDNKIDILHLQDSKIIKIMIEISNKGIRLEDLTGILSKLNINENIDSLINEKYVFEINGYYYMNEAVSSMPDKCKDNKESEKIRELIVERFVRNLINIYDENISIYCINILRHILPVGYSVYNTGYISVLKGVGEGLLMAQSDAVYDFFVNILKYKPGLDRNYELSGFELKCIEAIHDIEKRRQKPSSIINKIYGKIEWCIMVALGKGMNNKKKGMNNENIILYDDEYWDEYRIIIGAYIFYKRFNNRNKWNKSDGCAKFIVEMMKDEKYAVLFEQFVFNYDALLFLGEELLLFMLFEIKTYQIYNCMDKLYCSDRIYAKILEKEKLHKRNDNLYYSYMIALIYRKHENNELAYKMLQKCIYLYKRLSVEKQKNEVLKNRIDNNEGKIIYYDIPSFSNMTFLISETLVMLANIAIADILYDCEKYVESLKTFESLKEVKFPNNYWQIYCPLINKYTSKELNSKEYVQYRIDQCKEKLQTEGE